MLPKVILAMLAPTFLAVVLRVWLDHESVRSIPEPPPAPWQWDKAYPSIASYTAARSRFLQDASLSTFERRYLLLAMFELEAGREIEGILALRHVPPRVWSGPSDPVGPLLMASGRAGHKEVFREMFRLHWRSLPPGREADRIQSYYLNPDWLFEELRRPLELPSIVCNFD